MDAARWVPVWLVAMIIIAVAVVVAVVWIHGATPDPTAEEPVTEADLEDAAERDEFDRHADQALAIANAGSTVPVWCDGCRTFIQIRAGHVLEDVTAHGRAIHSRVTHAADFDAWETELKRSTP